MRLMNTLYILKCVLINFHDTPTRHQTTNLILFLLYDVSFSDKVINGYFQTRDVDTQSFATNRTILKRDLRTRYSCCFEIYKM